MHGIGEIYFQRQEDLKGFEYASQAASQDLPEALCRIGWCFEYGMGCERNEFIALDHYEQAAKGLSTHGFRSGLRLLFADIPGARTLHFEEQIKLRAKFFRHTHAIGAGVDPESLDTKPYFEWRHHFFENDNPSELEKKVWLENFVEKFVLFGKNQLRISPLYETTMAFLEEKADQTPLGQTVLELFKAEAERFSDQIALVSLSDSWSLIHSQLSKVLTPQLLDEIYKHRKNWIAKQLFLFNSLRFSNDLAFMIFAYLGVATPSYAEKQIIFKEARQDEPHQATTRTKKNFL